MMSEEVGAGSGPGQTGICVELGEQLVSGYIPETVSKVIEGSRHQPRGCLLPWLFILETLLPSD